ncbi:MAG: ribonuclease HI [Acidobacteria bacterium]|nr:ribonuclease HI [Acidobacteriota bacterium]
MRPRVEIFCDGACLGNPGPGGWAYLLRSRARGGYAEKEGSGGQQETTNNRMELTAAIRGLEALTRPCSVELFSDSQYVVKGLREWMAAWSRAGWRKADRSPVLNVDLWQDLERLSAIHSVAPHWVRGHSGHPENERVDRLARARAEELL